MKIAFLNPPGPKTLYRGTICTLLSKANYICKPKDFLVLSSKIPPDWDVVFLDASIRGIKTKAALEWLDFERPQVVIVAMSSITWEADFDFIKSFKAKFPKISLIVFGEVFLEPFFYKLITDYVDDVIFDPLKYQLTEKILYGFSKNNLSCEKTKQAVLVKTYPARHDLFDDTRYRHPFAKMRRYAAIYTQYGCPFSCSYCTESTTTVSYRAYSDVLDELELVYSQGYKEINFTDASFGYPRKNALNLLLGMRHFNFGWSAYIHPSLISEEFIKLMKEAGCHTVILGIDSANMELLKSYGRKINLSSLESCIKICHKNRIEVCGDLIIGFPNETRESSKKTMELALALNVDYVSINIATPLMGTSIRKDLIKHNKISCNSTGFNTTGIGLIATGSNLTGKELQKLRSQLAIRFYLRPHYLLKRLCRIRNFEEFLIKLKEALGLVTLIFRQLVQSQIKI